MQFQHPPILPIARSTLLYVYHISNISYKLHNIESVLLIFKASKQVTPAIPVCQIHTYIYNIILLFRLVLILNNESYINLLECIVHTVDLVIS